MNFLFPLLLLFILCYTISNGEILSKAHCTIKQNDSELHKLSNSSAMQKLRILNNYQIDTGKDGYYGFQGCAAKHH